MLHLRYVLKHATGICSDSQRSRLSLQTSQWDFRYASKFPQLKINIHMYIDRCLRRLPKIWVRIFYEQGMRSFASVSWGMVSYCDFRILNLSLGCVWGDSRHFAHKKLTGRRWSTNGAKHSCAPERFRHSPLADKLILRSQSGAPQFTSAPWQIDEKRCNPSRSQDENMLFMFTIASVRISPNPTDFSPF